MPRPSLVFFNEQPDSALAATVTPTVVTQLRLLRAGVAMALLDLSDERATTVRQLEAAGVPVHAWLLVPRDEGYFATHHNAPAVERAYDAFLAWRARHQLSMKTVGLDFEPDVRDLDVLMGAPVRTVGRWLASRTRGRALESALGAYRALVRRMQADGFVVETYQFPLVLDDRLAGTRFWQRTLGVLDVEADRQVFMLYTSLMGAAGPGLLARYAPHTRAVGVGSTGGGIDSFPKLTRPELERDLVIAARWAKEVYLFSLEGCVEQGLTDGLISIEWDRPVVSGRQARVLAGAAGLALRHLARLG
jgi:hypothetical protein